MPLNNAIEKKSGSGKERWSSRNVGRIQSG